MRRPGTRKRRARALARWIAVRSAAKAPNYGHEWTTRTVRRWKGELDPPLLILLDSFAPRGKR